MDLTLFRGEDTMANVSYHIGTKDLILSEVIHTVIGCQCDISVTMSDHYFVGLLIAPIDELTRQIFCSSNIEVKKIVFEEKAAAAS